MEQHITFNEFLPLVLGKEGIYEHQLNLYTQVRTPVRITLYIAILNQMLPCGRKQSSKGVQFHFFIEYY